MKVIFGPIGNLVVAAAMSLLTIASTLAAPVDDFYKDRQIRFVIGSSVGGSYDRVGRLVAHHLARNIPGKPTMVPQNMHGASSIVAANYLYNVGPQDGSMIAVVVQDVPATQLFKNPNAAYDTGKMQWIGNPSASPVGVAVWHTTPIKSIEDAKKQEVLVGSSSRTGSDGILPIVLNDALGTKFKVVIGYGGEGTMLAMERGETWGRGGLALSAWKAARPDWIKDGKVKFIVQIGLKKDADFPDVPLATELADSEENRQVLGLFSIPSAFGYPFVTGQDVPAERVAVLRQAFRDTMTDETFVQAAQKARLEIAPVYGEELQDAVREYLNYPPSVVERAKAAMGQ